MRYFKFIISVAALLAMTGCNSQSGTNLSDQNNQVSVITADSNQSPAAAKWAEDDPEDYNAWQEVLENPGVAGVDYDPNWITVNYFQNATPSISMTDAPPAGQRASDKRNAILRTNPGFETITDAIAARFGLEIGSQVYYGRLNYACFGVPEGIDGDSLITDIRSEFGNVVNNVTYDGLMYPCYTPNDPWFQPPASEAYFWHLKKCNFEEAWDYTRGDPNVRVAVVDTGCRITHEELTGQVLDPQVHFPGQQLDIANNDNTMEDNHSHGTFLCGLVAAKGDNNRTMVGAAPGCRVIPIKISEDGSLPPYPQGHSRFAEGCMLGFTLGAKAINLSWRSTREGTILEDMVNEIWDGGGILFVSAANDGNTNRTYPASFENAVAVGNSKPDDSRSPSSTYGDWVDIAAPGHVIASTGNHHDDDYHNNNGSGTSYSAPITAAAAALLWSYDPSLTNVEIRELLETTGAPTTGFNESPEVEILRLDIAAAFAAMDPLEITAPKPDRLFYRGIVEFEPVVSGDPGRVELYVNGAFIEQQTQEPFVFQVDTLGTELGLMNVSFLAVKSTKSVEAALILNVDNSEGRSTYAEDFEGAWNLYGGDLKSYSQSFLDEIKSISFGWTTDDLLGAGQAYWGPELSNPQSGQKCAVLKVAGDTYGDFEIDAVSTSRMDLSGVTNPSLVFYQRYNIEQAGSPGDIARVLVTTDGGQTFSPAPLNGGGNAEFAGYQADWQKVEVDLSSFTSEPIHIAFVFESDMVGAGEQAGEPAGWFIDSIVIASEYAEVIPLIDDVILNPASLIGAQPDVSTLNLEVTGAQNVAQVRYILDCVPLGEPGGDDLEITVDAGEGFAGLLELHLAPVVNQIAVLHVEYVDATGYPGEEFSLPVTLFNFLGDVNADGIVDNADVDAFAPMLGLRSDDPGYIAFFDSDLDGMITESDAAAVGYHWGSAGL